MKKCPFCAEEIQDEAIKCKHCGEFLAPKIKLDEKIKEPWYSRTSTIAVVFCTAGPLAVPLVWLNKSYSLVIKILMTVVMLALSWWMYLSIQNMMVLFNQYVKSVGITL